MPFAIRKGLKAALSQFTDKSNKVIDADLDEVEANYSHYKPVSIQTLLKSTQFTRRELQIIYRAFKEDCPTGFLTEDIFKMIYGKFFPQGDANMYAHHVFRTFANSNQGKVTFEQLVRCLSALIHGTSSNKLMWIFNLYDTEGDGVIDKTEMFKVVQSIYDLLGKHTDPPYEETTVKEHAEFFFNKLDLNQDGVISPEEFLEACQNDPNISDALGCLHTTI